MYFINIRRDLLAEVLDDPTPMTRTRPWVVNGKGTNKKAKLHTSSSCWKVTYPHVTQSLSIAEAATRICERCVDSLGNHQDLKDVWEVSNAFLELRTRVAAAARALDDEPTVNDVAAIRQDLRAIERSLRKFPDRFDDIDPVSKAYAALVARVDQLLGQCRERLADGEDEFLRWCASTLVAGPDSAIEYDERILFGSGMGYTHRAGMMTQQWAEQLRKDGDLTAAAARVHEVVSQARLENLNQLAVVPVPSSDGTHADTSLHEQAERQWRQHCATTAEKMLSRWEKAYRAALKRTEPVTIGAAGSLYRRADSPGHTAEALYQVAVDPENRRHVLVAPRLVADVIQTQTGVSWSWDIVHVLPDSVSASTAEAVVTLWDPHSEDSTYYELSDAVAAGELL